MQLSPSFIKQEKNAKWKLVFGRAKRDDRGIGNPILVCAIRDYVGKMQTGDFLNGN